MAISSNTLFHFMREPDYLKQSLTKMSLWPRFVVEHGWKVKFAVPMICLCDIPLSEMKNHLEQYGPYGLGFSKKFVEKNENINPILYVSRPFLKQLSVFTKNNELSDDNKSRTLMTRIKPYKDKEDDTCYYNEREWRYVPDCLEPKERCIKVTRETNLELENKKTDNFVARLKFEIEDIKYLFIEKEEERLDFINFIDSLTNDISEQGKAVLKSRIISKNQILEDF